MAFGKPASRMSSQRYALQLQFYPIAPSAGVNPLFPYSLPPKEEPRRSQRQPGIASVIETSAPNRPVPSRREVVQGMLLPPLVAKRNGCRICNSRYPSLSSVNGYGEPTGAIGPEEPVKHRCRHLMVLWPATDLNRGAIWITSSFGLAHHVSDVRVIHPVLAR